MSWFKRKKDTLQNWWKRKRDYRRLSSVDKNSIEDFSFKGRYTALISSIYDGDTIRCIFVFRGGLTKVSCRLYGIDTPEIRTKNEEEKVAGYKARDRLIELCLDKKISCEFLHNDKYGRPLVILFSDHNRLNFADSINQQLINEGHAVFYNGKKKQKFVG